VHRIRSLRPETDIAEGPKRPADVIATRVRSAMGQDLPVFGNETRAALPAKAVIARFAASAGRYQPEARKPRGKQTPRSLPVHAVCSFEGETASAGTSFALLRRENSGIENCFREPPGCVARAREVSVSLRVRRDRDLHGPCLKTGSCDITSSPVHHWTAFVVAAKPDYNRSRNVR